MLDFHAYFLPLNQGIYSLKERWETTQIGRLIESYTQDNFPSLDSVEIAIFNIKEYEGSKNLASEDNCKIRDALYRLHFDSIPRVVDLGELALMPTRKESFRIIEEVCVYLFNKGILPFIIGGGKPAYLDIAFLLFL